MSKRQMDTVQLRRKNIAFAFIFKRDIQRQYFISRIPIGATQKQLDALKMKWTENNCWPNLAEIFDAMQRLRRAHRKITLENVRKVIGWNGSDQLIEEWRAECGFSPFKQAE